MPVLDSSSYTEIVEKEEKIFKVWTNNDGYLLEIDDISVQIKETDDLFTVGTKIEEKKKDLIDLRFYHKDHIVCLDEKFKEMLTFDENIYVFVNGEEYVIDVNNSFLRSGNTLYNDDRFYKALEKFNIAVKRHPLKIKGYANRALCHQKLDNDKSAIEDCNKFLEIYKTLPSDLQKTDGDVLPRVYYRKARSCFKLASKLVEFSSSDDETTVTQDPLPFYEEALENLLQWKSMIDDAEFEKGSAHINEFYISINSILNAKGTIPLCLLCQEVKETQDTFIFPEIQKTTKFCCKECNEKLKIVEDKFIEQVYKPFYESGKEFTVENTNEWLFKYLVILTWKNISVQDMRDMRFHEKPYTLMNKYHNMRNYLFKGEWIQLDTYLYYTSKKEPNQTNDNIIQYMKGFNFDYYVTHDRCSFVHSQLKHLHIVTLIHELTYNWDSEKKVVENDEYYKFIPEEERSYELPQPLIELIVEKTNLTQ